MDDRNNQNRFDDFFDRHDNKKDEEKGDKERPTFYYSYGPFKSEDREDLLSPPADSTTMDDSGGVNPVEITRPREMRPYYEPQPEPVPLQPQTSRHTGKQGGASFRSMFASFMAGVLVVGSLMFASDKMNLFTGSPADAAGPQTYTSAAGGNGVQYAAMLGSDLQPGTIADIVTNASPAVVKIETTIRSNSRSRTNPWANDPFFRDFFGDFFNSPSPSDQSIPGGVGSGFIFEAEGYILTNEHVIAGADEIYVTVQGYKDRFKATLLGTDFNLDLAVLKIEGKNPFPILNLGSSDDLRVGDWVTAIGNPVGFDHTVSVGVLSAKERAINIQDQQGTRRYQHLLQTDASINPGNSGGPLLNLYGEVIGINTAVSAQAQGIGFAIPTSTISAVLDNLKNNIKVPIPYIGVGLVDISEDWLTEFQLENTDGAIITQVEIPSPANRGGLRAHDVILEVNGSKIKNTEELVAKIQAAQVGNRFEFIVMRDGKKLQVGVVIGDKNSPQ